MEYQGLRDWLEKVDGLGELRRIEGAHWDKEMGAITEILYRMKAERSSALLFDKIPDYPPGYRCLYGMLNSPKRLALTLGMPLEFKNRMEYLKTYRGKTKNIKPIPLKVVKSGPVMEKVITGKDIDLYKFPVPVHHELDEGRFIGTGDCVITKDPEEGWVNLGTYRMQVIAPNKAISYITPGRHGRIHRDKYLEKGKPAPMAVVLGPDPLLWSFGGIDVPHGISEYEYAGGLKGKPFEVIEGPITGLPIQADAEIVLEGEISPTEKAVEGRFGEWSGYYCSTPAPEPVFIVKAIYHRNNPILNCAASNRPPHAHLFPRCVMRSAMLWDALERADIPEVKGVWCHEAGAGWSFNVISIKQRFFGHSRMAAYVASHTRAGAYINRFTVVVDEDIDPSNMYDVLWAMSTRCNPEEDIEIAKKGWSSKIDPLTFTDRYYNSRAIIDACRSFEHIHDFPVVAETGPELKAKILEKWKEVFE